MSKSDIKFKVHCKIIDYVEQQDPELAQIIRGVCSEGALTSLKGKPGITFLMPIDKEFRAKLHKLATSDNYEDVDKANDMVNALIIRANFKTPADWMAQKDDIPNSLYPYQHVEIDSVTAKEVVFKSGARAELDTKFIDGSKKKQLSVWKLTTGEIPVTKDKKATGKYSAKRGDGNKTGGYTPTATLSNSLRWQIAVKIENAYAESRMKSRSLFSAPAPDDVYRTAILSLVKHIHESLGEGFLIDKVLPFITWSKLDFYILVEPHRVSGSFILSNETITRWWQGDRNCNCAEVDALICSLFNKAAQTNNAAIYTNHDQVMKSIADARQEIIRISDSGPRKFCDAINMYYADLEQNNKIGNCSNVLPEQVANYYKSEPGLKLTHDMLSYYTYCAFYRLEGSFNVSNFNALVNYIGDNLHADADSRAAVRSMMVGVTTGISPVEKIGELKIFTSSTAFLQIPMNAEEKLKQKNTTTKPDPDNLVLFNIAAANRNAHNRIFSLGQVQNISVANIAQL